MNDELIRFAAEKLGVAIFHDKGWPFHQPAWFYTDDFTHKKFDLSSPDLFLRGLGVIPDRYDWKIERAGKYLCVHVLDHHTSQTFTEICDDSIPEAFWACWFKLEKGGG